MTVSTYLVIAVQRIRARGQKSVISIVSNQSAEQPTHTKSPKIDISTCNKQKSTPNSTTHFPTNLVADRLAVMVDLLVEELVEPLRVELEVVHVRLLGTGCLAGLVRGCGTLTHRLAEVEVDL